MTDREALAAAVANRPREETIRLAFADWFDDHDQPGRAAYIRAACAAARSRPGSEERADHLDRADDLLAAHEADWLGTWRDRLVDWEFRRGFLHRVRMTAADFLADGADLLRAEPVVTVELVGGDGKSLPADAVRAVVGSPAFASVRDCAVVPGGFLHETPVGVWMTAIAENPQVGRLRRFGPSAGGAFEYNMRPDVRTDGIEPGPVEAFGRAAHLGRLRRLALPSSGSGYAGEKPWLVPALARAVFAGRLRGLELGGNRLGADALRRLGADPAFGQLRSLGVNGTCDDPAGWAGVFRSPHLTALRRFVVGADRLPEYARSPLATRVRDLTVVCANDLDRDTSPDGRAWLDLIDRGRPPGRLGLRRHNPGREAFRAMREGRWLRRVRELDIRGDSQYEVYSGRTAGVRSLLRPGVLPRLTRLRLHEVCDGRTRAALAEWGGLTRLEALELTDDYHGRQVLDDFDPVRPPERLRVAGGVILMTPADVGRFLGWPRLERLERLHVSFASEYAGGHEFVARIDPATAEQAVRSGRLDNLTELRLGFHEAPAVKARLAGVLADPAVLPRLRRLTFYGGSGHGSPDLSGLRARFGPRLTAW